MYVEGYTEEQVAWMNGECSGRKEVADVILAGLECLSNQTITPNYFIQFIGEYAKNVQQDN